LARWLEIASHLREDAWRTRDSGSELT